LWYDVTQGFGQKWKDFFLELEATHGLDASKPGHIWLLHYLFLQDIQDEATTWANTWNSHLMTLSKERDRSPEDMFVFDMLTRGPRGLDGLFLPDPEPVNPQEFGVAWEDFEDEQLMTALAEGPEVRHPAHLHTVDVEAPPSPFTEEEVAQLDTVLTRLVGRPNTMLGRRALWDAAIATCKEIVSRNNVDILI
jgi:hypothetical protein